MALCPVCRDRSPQLTAATLTVALSYMCQWRGPRKLDTSLAATYRGRCFTFYIFKQLLTFGLPQIVWLTTSVCESDVRITLDAASSCVTCDVCAGEGRTSNSRRGIVVPLILVRLYWSCHRSPVLEQSAFVMWYRWENITGEGWINIP